MQLVYILCSLIVGCRAVQRSANAAVDLSDGPDGPNERDCQSWCQYSTRSWATKCRFNVCNACADCGGPTACEQWCFNDKRPWSTKCQYDQKCANCVTCETGHTDSPTPNPTQTPTQSPTDNPTESPTQTPTQSPTDQPTQSPTDSPTQSPTDYPTQSPTDYPTQSPTQTPTQSPTQTPTQSPTDHPTQSPTDYPTKSPTDYPTRSPTDYPTRSPTDYPTPYPTKYPTQQPTLPLKVRVWISQHFHKESPCWEAGQEEYTMGEMKYTLSGESQVSQGCLQCSNNGNCYASGNWISRDYMWGTSNSRSISTYWRGWEDDSGSRCSVDSGFWINDDDCHQSKSCSATIYREVASSTTCESSGHGMVVSWSFFRG